MKLYRTAHSQGRTANSSYVKHEGLFYRIPMERWDDLVNLPDLAGYLVSLVAGAERAEEFDPRKVMVPLESQSVWAAGVTYYRSRSARMAEAKDAGGGDFYDRVYTAKRPELFFKAGPEHIAGTGQHVHIRRDAKWSVPEPELTVLLDARGRIVGYTVGNDMSSRDIEGENPLYLPQAKVYDRSCALGPCILVASEPLPATTPIHIEIERHGAIVFSGSTTLAELKRPISEMAEHLFRENSFPHGVFLMTGTGIVPPDDFSLTAHDRIRITIDPIGTLTNDVVQNGPLSAQ
ncbi:MAG: fumarylacetoacetate hydrolase family protein [Terracidiphilus sp.]